MPNIRKFFNAGYWHELIAKKETTHTSRPNRMDFDIDKHSASDNDVKFNWIVNKIWRSKAQ